VNARSPLERLILVVNSLGFAAYLFWLVARSGRIFYTQEGVLYLLPCVAFFFVFAFIARSRQAEEEPRPHKED
jgi:hypothetical protein